MNKILRPNGFGGRKGCVSGWLILFAPLLMIPSPSSAAPCTGDLTAKINCLNNKLKYVSMETDAGGKPVLKISGANVRLVSSAANDKTGNLVVGEAHDWSGSTSGVVTGYGNTIAGSGTTVMGGKANIADGDTSTICGGWTNEINAGQKTVAAGGYNNHAIGIYDVIIGGSENRSDSDRGSIIGGYNNYNEPASGIGTTIKGGMDNNVEEGNYASIVGGSAGIVKADYSSIAGSNGGRAEGRYAAIVGGSGSLSDGEYSLIVGGSSNGAYSTYGTIAAGDCSSVSADYGTTCGGHHGFPWVGIAPTSSGGYRSYSLADYAAVNGGNYTEMFAKYGWAAGDLSVPTILNDCTCPSGCDSIVSPTLPFSFTGVGEGCYFFSAFNYMNSWETVNVNIDTVNVSNKWISVDDTSIPIVTVSIEDEDYQGYFVYYKGTRAWSHIEVN